MRKNQKFVFNGIPTMDNSVPSINAVIQILSARGKKVLYCVMHGTEPTNSDCYFYKNSEIANNLIQIQ